MNGKLLVFCAENYNKTILLKAFTTFSTSCALPRLCHREMNYLEADAKVSKRLYTSFAPYPLYVAKWLFFIGRVTRENNYRVFNFKAVQWDKYALHKLFSEGKSEQPKAKV